MRTNGITPILNVSDVGASLRWFRAIGWRACWSYNDGGMIEGGADGNEHGPANFAAVAPAEGDVEIFLCRGGQGSRGNIEDDCNEAGAPSGTWMSWWVPDVDAAHAEAEAGGAEVIWPPTDEPWGCRECRIRHPDGHVFRLSGPCKSGHEA
ncbi:MAG: VOC family protein [Planctomycetes bacterium]|nr:VOC family protein [Planctomycetota bacterium]